MSVYNDMANDAGYSFGSEENEQMAMLLEEQEYRAWQEYYEQEFLKEQREVLFRKF